MKSYLYRITKLMCGLFLYAVGIYLIVQAHIGLAPWDAFTQGLSVISGISFGTMTILSGIAILLIAVLLKEKIGVGTVLNTVFIGVFINFLYWLDLVQVNKSFGMGIAMLLIGQLFIALASYLYISAGLGCGPRDSLMVALCKRLPRVPVGAVRACLEGTVLLIGWLMGATVGWGTLIAVFTIGFILEWIFGLMRFDVKALEHESIFATWRKLNNKGHGYR